MISLIKNKNQKNHGCQQLNQAKRAKDQRIKSLCRKHQALKGKFEIKFLILIFKYSLLLFNPNEIVDDNSMVAQIVKQNV